MKKNGYTLIELLIVIAVFAVIAFVSAQTIILTLESTHKADNTTKVRDNLDYALGEMSRQLHNAGAVTCSGGASDHISFSDPNGNPVMFSCINIGSAGSAIASTSSSLVDLTSTTDTQIVSCIFTCTTNVSPAPPTVKISVVAADPTGKNQVSDETEITLRTY